MKGGYGTGRVTVYDTEYWVSFERLGFVEGMRRMDELDGALETILGAMHAGEKAAAEALEEYKARALSEGADPSAFDVDAVAHAEALEKKIDHLVECDADPEEVRAAQDEFDRFVGYANGAISVQTIARGRAIGSHRPAPPPAVNAFIDTLRATIAKRVPDSEAVLSQIAGSIDLARAEIGVNWSKDFPTAVETYLKLLVEKVRDVEPIRFLLPSGEVVERFADLSRAHRFKFFEDLALGWISELAPAIRGGGGDFDEGKPTGTARTQITAAP